MYPWRRILVPTDFSTASAWVFDDAVRIAGTTGAEIVILHVRMTRSSQPEELRFPADVALYEYAERIELDKLQDRVRRANATLATRLLVRSAPDPGAEICRTAIAEGIDLVVIATHARHHVAHLIVGSTTLGVLAGIHVPLLAIRYGIHLRHGMKRIMVLVRHGQRSSAALVLAGEIARREGGEIHLVTVAAERDQAVADAFLGELVGEHAAGLRTSTAVLTGSDVERELLRHLEAKSEALFVDDGGERSQLKSDLIRKAAVPVMVVPEA